MPTKKPGRDSRSTKPPSKPTAQSPQRPTGLARVDVARDLHCADLVGRDKTTTTYNFAPASLEKLIARLLAFLEGGAVFQLQGDRLAAELNGDTLVFRPGAIGSLMHRRSPRAYWLGLIVDPQHSIWATLFVPLKATADVAQVPLEIRLNYREYIPATGPETQPRTETLEDITEAVRKHRAFVIVGDPGAGKTTTLRKLALDHARAALANDRELPAPFFVRLSQQGEQSPYEFLSAQWQQCTGGDFGDALGEGGLLILADGLNELPRDSEVRRARLKAWREFVQDDAGRNQFVFTSRERGEYAGELDLPNVRVEPLDSEGINEYVRRWKAEGLLPYLKDPKSRLGELARNPFYLNLLVHAHHDDAALLANRGRLLRQFVRRLWGREERQARKDWIETSVQHQELSALAYAMQVKGVNLTLAAQDAATLLPTSVDVNDDEPVHVKPRALFRLARAELLLDPVLETEVRFYHQLLQEYFAAEALLARFESGEDESAHWLSPRQAGEMPPAEVGEWDPLPEPPGTGWEETTILACGLSEQPERLISAVRAHNPNLAARCWLESGVVWGDTREAMLKPQLQQDLLANLYDPSLHLRTRLQVGHTLGWLGDPRFVAQVHEGVRFIAPTLLPVPAGRYTVGRLDEHRDGYTNERPRHIVDLAAFAIGRWPVTNAEFSCFIDAGGYNDEQWWETDRAKRWLRRMPEDSGLNWEREVYFRWRQTNPDYWRNVSGSSAEFEVFLAKQFGIHVQLGSINTKEELTKLLIEATSKEMRNRPAYLDDRLRSNPSQPVVGVTWFEARAYCVWLSTVMGIRIRLPSEIEWEAAARGWDHRRYPWGSDWDGARANTLDKVRVLRPSPVGAFAAVGGYGLFRVEDQSGNVWEWTNSLDKGYEAPESASERCVRGGSWSNHPESARCTARHILWPHIFNDNVGFRVASFSSTSAAHD